MGMGGRELFKIYCQRVWNSVLRVGGALGHAPTAHPPSRRRLALLARFHSSSQTGSRMSSPSGAPFPPGSLGLTPPKGLWAMAPRGRGSACTWVVGDWR